MNRFRVILFSFLSALLTPAVFMDPVSKSYAEDSPTAAIRKVLEDQVAAWNRGDLDGFMKGYWNSPELIFSSGGNVQRGWQSTLDRYRQTYSSQALMGTLSFSDLEIHGLVSNSGKSTKGPQAAWVLGKWHLKRTEDEPHGIFTLVFQKFPETSVSSSSGWKIVHDHTSSQR